MAWSAFERAYATWRNEFRSVQDRTARFSGLSPPVDGHQNLYKGEWPIDILVGPSPDEHFHMGGEYMAAACLTCNEQVCEI